MKEKNLVIDNFEITPNNKGEKENFCVFNIDPVLLHPSIQDIDLKRKEVYNLRFAFDESHKGHIKLQMFFKSLTEMYKVYIELKRIGYRPKIEEEHKNSRIDEVILSLKDIKKYKDVSPFGGLNVINIWIEEKGLDKFKSDILSLRQKLGYRNVWGDRDIWNGLKCTNREYKFIID